ncbi:RepB family plasmid replication initiator protein [Escherichia coli]|nr:RepB family plasmid replication initiator protein [Escherichia coli]
MSNNALQTIINARLPGKEGLWQIHLQDGKISAIDAQSGVMPITENSLDAEQGLVIPPFVEPHIHLDTTQTAGQPNWNQSGTLFEGIERWAERKALLTHDDVKQRAWQTLKWQIANGETYRAQYAKGEARAQITFSDAVMPYLTQLQGQFTRVVIKNISRLSRSYSIRIYELLQQFRSTGERIIALDDFRSMLDIEHKYQTYKSLNQQLLRPCIDELNKKSDLAVTVETIKKGRTVVALHFRFKEDKQIKMTI